LAQRFDSLDLGFSGFHLGFQRLGLQIVQFEPNGQNRRDTQYYAHVANQRCWNERQKSLSKRAESIAPNYILKVDVAHFFGSLNQDTIINVLNDSGYPKSLSSRLEAILTSETGERSSRGILQGSVSLRSARQLLSGSDRPIAVICWRAAWAPILRLIRFERCLVVFVAAHPESDRLILAPKAVVTTAAGQSCADRERLKCQRSYDAEGQNRPPGKAITFPLPDQQQLLH
jgi:hypothetical protein